MPVSFPFSLLLLWGLEVMYFLTGVIERMSVFLLLFQWTGASTGSSTSPIPPSTSWAWWRMFLVTTTVTCCSTLSLMVWHHRLVTWHHDPYLLQHFVTTSGVGSQMSHELPWLSLVTTLLLVAVCWWVVQDRHLNTSEGHECANIRTEQHTFFSAFSYNIYV